MNSWWDGLPPETLRELHSRHPGLTLDAIAVAAIRDPVYAGEFAQLGARVVEYDPRWGRPRWTGDRARTQTTRGLTRRHGYGPAPPQRLGSRRRRDARELASEQRAEATPPAAEQAARRKAARLAGARARATGDKPAGRKPGRSRLRGDRRSRAAAAHTGQAGRTSSSSSAGRCEIAEVIPEFLTVDGYGETPDRRESRSAPALAQLSR